ncbi:MAG: NAD(P)-dependent oxidoreductase [Nitrososphaerota archaeon]|nr:NAD(P)-dependent oxidoreductase [Nitrososphaerota archaeon]
MRPKYSVFDLSKIQNTFNLEIPEWDRSLEVCLGCLVLK